MSELYAYSRIRLKEESDMRNSTLSAGLKVAARPKTAPPTTATKQQPATAGTMLIGAHFQPEVRRALLLVQAEQAERKTLKQLLGEAINDLCAKCGKPQPYGGEE